LLTCSPEANPKNLQRNSIALFKIKTILTSLKRSSLLQTYGAYDFYFRPRGSVAAELVKEHGMLSC
jgi:hypothetical protein